MSKTYIINLTMHGYTCTSSSSYVRSDRLNRYTNSTSYERFGATGSYSTGYATRGDWPDSTATTHLKSLGSSHITSIVLHATCSGVGYDIGTRWGLSQSANSAGNAQLTQASKSTVTVSKGATSISITATSKGLPTYGWVIGGTQSSTSFGTISKMWVVITTDEENVTGTPYVSLFQGVWNSGSVTINGLSDYGLFLVKFQGYATGALAMFGGESDSYFRGKGGYSSSSTASQGFYVACERSSDTLTFTRALYRDQSNSCTSISISEILGII